MSAPEDLSKFTFYAVAAQEEIPSGERLFLEIGEHAIVVFNIAGRLYAIGDVCTHDNGPLGDGELDGYQIICPRHGARFDVRDGNALALPAVEATPAYPVRVNAQAEIEVGIPEA